MPDRYEAYARLAPAYLVIASAAPLLVLANFSIGARLIPLLFSFVFAPILAGWVRRKGKQIETAVWAGGLPAEAILRATPHYRQRVGALLEIAPDDLGGVAISREAVARLREMTRDRARFPVVFSENSTYGFERNLLGMRPLGIVVTTLALFLALGALIAGRFGLVEVTLQQAVLVLVLQVLVGACWLAWPSKERVIQAANQYAHALLKAAVAELP